MQCVGYDVDFQREVAAKLPHFVPPVKKPRESKNAKSKNAKIKTKS